MTHAESSLQKLCNTTYLRENMCKFQVEQRENTQSREIRRRNKIKHRQEIICCCVIDSASLPLCLKS